jgi:hypothetical protein
LVIAHEAANYAQAGTGDTPGATIVDIHQQRLELMEEYDVEIQLLYLTSPVPQGTHRRRIYLIQVFRIEAAKGVIRPNDFVQ